ncbi:MAG: cyclic nucleotide-binding domain-containing protein [SAR324 cluster bacterium]|nr:cyclic nucleotide-binding domain-containing protein [SAR324 cluster bacterium]
MSDQLITHLLEDNQDIIHYLKDSRIFSHLPAELLEQLLPLSELRNYPTGSEILSEGKLNTTIFFLVRGTVAVSSGGEVILRLRRRGDIFGEMSVISNNITTATVIAETPVTVFSIQINSIAHFTEIHGDTLHHLLYRLFSMILTEKLTITTYKARQYESTNRNLKQTMAILEHRAEQAKLVTMVSTLFINLPASKIETEIYNVLRLLGEKYQAHSGHLILLNVEKLTVEQAYDWNPGHETTAIHHQEQLNLDTLDWIVTEMQRLKIARVPHFGDVHSVNEDLSREKEKLPIHSLNCIPIHYENQLVGFLGLDTKWELSEWSMEDFATLKLIGEIRVNALRRKKAEETRQEFNRTLQTMIQASPLAMIVTDSMCLVEMWNPATEKLFEWGRQEMLDQFITIIDPESESLFQIMCQRLLKGETCQEQVLATRTKSGKRLNIALSGAPLRNNQNQITRMMFIVLYQVDSGVKGQTTYLAGLAETAIATLHNIGNALTPMIWNLEEWQITGQLNNQSVYLRKLFGTMTRHLEQGDLPEYLKQHPKGRRMLGLLEQFAEELEDYQQRQQEFLKNMDLQLTHATEIIILQQKYANYRLESESFQIADLIQDVINMMKASLEKRDIHLVQLVEENLPPLVSNKNKLMQVLLNMLKNAIESIDERLLQSVEPAPEIVIKSSLCMGKWVDFSIEDNGIGVSTDARKHLFEFGFTTKSRGSGFGLHDCANFIREQKGHIRFESPDLGQGARIVFQLPVKSGDSGDIF